MKPYNSSRSKKEEVRSMFDAIAFRYDQLNHLLSLGIDRSWRRKVVRRVKAFGANRILDVATGTGDLALMMARACPSATIEGIDLSEQMLAIGQQKVELADLQKRVFLSQGDAESLSMESDSYDCVTVAFGVRNFENIGRGMAEIHRVLRPGGRVYVLEFGLPKNKWLGGFYRFYFHRVLPGIGRWISKDKQAYTYLPKSVDHFPYGEGFVRVMREAGFEQVAYCDLFGGVAQIYEGVKSRNINA